MGRTILCPHCNSALNEDILKQKNSENICLVCGEPLDNGSGAGGDEHADWITWYYYGIKNSSSCWLLDEPRDSEERFYLIKEFKAPPKDENGNCDAAKRELRKYVPGAFAEPKVSPIHCPKCGSTEYTLMNRGYSIFTGFLGSGKVKRVCNRCKREF